MGHSVRQARIWITLFSSLLIPLTTTAFANDNEITQKGTYQVKLKEVTDSLNCRLAPNVNADKVIAYEYGTIIQATEVIRLSNNKHWLQTGDNCYVRAHNNYLITLATEETTKPKYPLANNSSPVMIALSQIPVFAGRSQHIDLNFNRVEAPTQASVIITEKGYLDDSIANGRHTFQLSKNASGHWIITGRQYFTQCHAGRGHQHYSSEPCQ